MLNIKIERPIVFFDLETTGTNFKNDRIVEISVVKYFPDGRDEVKTRLINPQMPIPKETSDLHGITDDKVKDAPTFRAISKNLYVYLEGCDLGGYNVLRFDIPMLTEEFKRVGLEFSIKGRRIVDPFIIFCLKEPRSLSAAYQFFCGKELEDAHSAEADTRATIEVLNGQMMKYDDLPDGLDGLDELCNPVDPNALDSTKRFRWRDDDVIVNFGKNSGIPLKQIAVENPGFLQWMINQDFPADAKAIAAKALKGEFPEKGEAEDSE